MSQHLKRAFLSPSIQSLGSSCRLTSRSAGMSATCWTLPKQRSNRRGLSAAELAATMSEGAVSLPFYQVDAFTSQRFCGNPAAVCLIPKGASISDDQMQKIAAENNLAETAYLELLSQDSSGSDDFSVSSKFGLRWFTPKTEVPLCGHATLASAAAIFFEVGNPSAELEFRTLSGSLFVKQLQSTGSSIAGAKAAAPFLEMKFPSLPASDPVPPNFGPESKVVKEAVGELPVAHVGWCSSLKYLLVVLSDNVTKQDLESLSPNMASLQASTEDEPMVGVIVTCLGSSDDGSSVVLSRFFAPWAGIPEDPVTGSAHSILCPYWAGVLGRSLLTARQCSPRGGDLEIELDAASNAVFIRGQAVTVIKGELLC